MHCIMFAVPFVVFVQMQQSYVPSIVSISHSGSDFTGIARLFAAQVQLGPQLQLWPQLQMGLFGGVAALTAAPSLDWRQFSPNFCSQPHFRKMIPPNPKSFLLTSSRDFLSFNKETFVMQSHHAKRSWNWTGTRKRPLLRRAHKIPETNLNPQRIIKEWSSLVVPPSDISPLLARLLSLSRSFSLKNARSVSYCTKHIYLPVDRFPLPPFSLPCSYLPHIELVFCCSLPRSKCQALVMPLPVHGEGRECKTWKRTL